MIKGNYLGIPVLAVKEPSSLNMLLPIVATIKETSYFRITLFFLLISTACLLGQPIIYTDATTLVTGTWHTNGTLTEITGDSPYEGNQHYEFMYNTATDNYANFGLNMDNWGSGPPIDFSPYTHLRIAYRGATAGQTLSVTLRNGPVLSNTLNLGSAVPVYSVIELPLLGFTSGTTFDLRMVTEIIVQVDGDNTPLDERVYVDNIELFTETTRNQTSATTWTRARDLAKGMNLSNWLEAYWLIPYGTYPETDRFTYDDLEGFREIGIDLIRLPVTFEHLAATTPPYTLNTSHPTFDLIDDVVAWCDALDLKLIIDMHHGVTTLTDANYQTELPRLEAIWRQIYALYGDLDPDQVFFEIYNEPHAISNSNFRIVAQALVDVLRAEGSAHSIIVGASGYNSATELAAFTPLDDPDIIYTFHFYDPYFFTHQGMSWTNPPYFPARSFPLGDEVAQMTSTIGAAADWGQIYNAPILLGEFGVSTEADDDSRCNWVETVADIVNGHNMPWVYWDSTSESDGFGFILNGELSAANVTPCFGDALGLTTILAVEELGPLQLDCQDNNPQLSWLLIADEPVQFEVQAYTEHLGWLTIDTHTSRVDQKYYGFSLTELDAYTAFRLRLTEWDGTVTYSRMVQNHCAAPAVVRIFPNPSPGYIYLSGMRTARAQLEVYNSLGQLVLQQAIASDQLSGEKPLSLRALPHGQYWLRVHDGAGLLYQGGVLLR
ncbi:MAG: hypothetical protein D6772_07915 [Bacteroidetes bacterium]|nr:MAG: hypothetical protein D6772_07915 [Bacteroidota bacterium]